MHGSIPMGEAWSLLDIARTAELQIAESIEKQLPTDAEIVPGTTAEWYLVQTFPGDDLRALRWLSRRRFGVFRPMQQRTEKKSGVALQGWEPAFPGWLFVFAWDIDKMRSRILSCPGVMGMLCDPATERPIPVDQPETIRVRFLDYMPEDYDNACTYPRVGFVDKLRALSWIYDENAPHARAFHSHSTVRGRRQIKRSFRKLDLKARRELKRLASEVESRRLFDEHEWEAARKLDPGRRIALLKRALLNASDAGCRALSASA